MVVLCKLGTILKKITYYCMFIKPNFMFVLINIGHDKTYFNGQDLLVTGKEQMCLTAIK